MDNNENNKKENENVYDMVPSDTSEKLIKVVEDEPNVVVEDEPSVVVEDEPSVVVEDEPSVVVEDEPSVVVEDEPSVVVEDEQNVVVEDEPSVVTLGDEQFFSSVAEVVRILSANVSANSAQGQGGFYSKFSQSEKTVEEKINDANERISKELFSIYATEERLRQKRQFPIMIAIIALLVIQLLSFNALIFILVLDGAKTIEIEVFKVLLDFLKYYIGAVIVELIGLIVTITANTFSSHLSKKMSKFLFDKK